MPTRRAVRFYVGRKRWFLSRPELKPDYDPDQTSIRWLTLTKDKGSPSSTGSNAGTGTGTGTGAGAGAGGDARGQGSKGAAGAGGGVDLYDCTLGPGEVLYIGHTWWHSTLNIGQTIFISTFL